MIAPRIELGTFCVLDRCDNHYTMQPLYLTVLCVCFNYLDISIFPFAIIEILIYTQAV